MTEVVVSREPSWGELSLWPKRAGGTAVAAAAKGKQKTSELLSKQPCSTFIPRLQPFPDDLRPFFLHHRRGRNRIPLR